ncbi:MAG: prolyl oligopeptidase family serine peptidase [Luteitalea sp.]|nr:prolyl oligopeptidase family serine peptidase [Luteitalea sp.]
MNRGAFTRRVLLLALIIAGPAGAQHPRPMTMVDLLNVPRITDAQLSPDGRQALFVKSEADWKVNERIEHIWRVDLDGSNLRQLTNGGQGESSPRWSPDGGTIAFVAKRGEDKEAEAQIWLIANDGGEARPLTAHETSVSAIAWAVDGTHVYFVAGDPKSADRKARDKAKDDVYALDEDYRQEHLWQIDVETQTETRVTRGDFSVIDYELSRDGTQIVYHRGSSPLIGDNEQREIWVMAADGSGAKQMTKNSATESDAELSPDNSQILFLAEVNAQFEFPYNSNLFLVPAEGGSGGSARIVTADFPHEVQDATWSKDGRAIYVLANMGLHSELFRFDVGDGGAVNGQSHRLTDGEHALSDWHYVAALDGHVFIEDTPSSPGEIWTLDQSHDEPRRVTQLFDRLAHEFKLPRQVRIEWHGADDETVEGLLYYPLDYRRGTRYPLVVQTHGGPHASDKFGFGAWSSYVQVLTAKGYAVLKPNYRGSTGYGDAFLRDMVGHYFENAHLDVLAGVDAVIAMGVADPDQLAAMGWSAGGHMTNKLITFTDRFKAAASGAGASNWVSMYGQSDVRSYRTPWFGGTPWQKDAPIQAYWDNSPLKDVANVKTPTLFLVGERDVRVPPPQSVEMHRALKANGVPTHLYMAPREAHGWHELRHELFKMNVELAWFEEHVTKRVYTWENAPAEEEEKKKETDDTTSDR